jgi:hypothetical protein
MPKVQSGSRTKAAIQVAAPYGRQERVPGAASPTPETRVSDMQTRTSAATSTGPRAAIQAFANKVRARVGSKVQNKMIATGTMWKEQDGINEFTTVIAQSKKNLSALREQLTPLSEDESRFVERFLKEPLFITHATDSRADVDILDGSVNLLSRQKFEDHNADFAENHTIWLDRSQIASQDNVFFSLEAGVVPKKPASRFGDRLLRFSFDQPRILSAATLHLEDPGAEYYSSVDGKFPVIENYKGKNDVENVKENLENRELKPLADFFHGHDMKIGLSLSIIAACVNSDMPEDMKKSMLEGTDLNDLINRLFRPTIMVPKSFFDHPVDDIQIRHQKEDLSTSTHPEDN